MTSGSGFAAHPSTIIAQNKTLLDQLGKQRSEAQQKVRAWEQNIKDRDLAEKRRKAPGWLDSEQHLLQPARAEESSKNDVANFMDDPDPTTASAAPAHAANVDDLGAAMDKAFGRSEMG